MNPTARSRKRNRSISARFALGCTVAATLLLSGVAAADNCRKVSGTISPLQPVACGSESPTASCFAGSFAGDLTGTFRSTLTNVVPVPNQPGSIAFSGSSVLNIETAPGGTVTTADGGVATQCQVYQGQNVCAYASEVLVITRGTRPFSNGTLLLSGPYLMGQPGAYSGVICRKGN